MLFAPKLGAFLIPLLPTSYLNSSTFVCSFSDSKPVFLKFKFASGSLEHKSTSSCGNFQNFLFEVSFEDLVLLGTDGDTVRCVYGKRSLKTVSLKESLNAGCSCPISFLSSLYEVAVCFSSYPSQLLYCMSRSNEPNWTWVGTSHSYEPKNKK